ncbi:MAG: 16S rRNA (guanine(527)-N(7))-methyltransferase RsmG, partial [Alphaproteobacteria bacterium]
MQYQEFCDKAGFDVSRETFAQLALYAELLEKWQSSINLVSKNTLADMWQRHFLDS